MAAVIDIATAERFDPSRGTRPKLRLVQDGLFQDGLFQDGQVEARTATSARTYLVRRLVVASVAVVLVVMTAQLLAVAGRAVLGALDATPAASDQVHVVAEGDTAWDLAARYAPRMDRRDAIDDLLALNGQGALRVGQEIVLPASFG